MPDFISMMVKPVSAQSAPGAEGFLTKSAGIVQTTDVGLGVVKKGISH